MRKFALIPMVALLALAACNKDNNSTPNPNPTDTSKKDTTIVLTGNLTTRTLQNDSLTHYLIKGTAVVGDGQVLTIEPGTIVKGDKATKGTLVIDQGGKLMAEGTAAEPIVFTSVLGPGERSRGDWGGVILLGRAPINQASVNIEGLSQPFDYGGTNEADNSGTLKYVRIEYAGIALSPGNETNGLTLGGVGSGTTIDYVQVSYGGDDSFEWFGGSVNARHLISLGCWDDDFDTDFGYHGYVQFAAAFRERGLADESQSNGFESDNDGTGTNATPKTSPVFSNVSFFGPRTDSNAISGNFGRTMHLRRNTALTVANSFISGWPRLLFIDGATTLANYQNGLGNITNNVMVVAGGKVNSKATVYETGSGNNSPEDQKAFVEAPSRNNTVMSLNSVIFDLFGVNANAYAYKNNAGEYTAKPTLAVTSGSLASGASFTGLPSFFEQVAYRGAFGPDDWTTGWTNFTPNQTNY